MGTKQRLPQACTGLHFIRIVSQALPPVGFLFTFPMYFLLYYDLILYTTFFNCYFPYSGIGTWSVYIISLLPNDNNCICCVCQSLYLFSVMFNCTFYIVCMYFTNGSYVVVNFRCVWDKPYLEQFFIHFLPTSLAKTLYGMKCIWSVIL